MQKLKAMMMTNSPSDVFRTSVGRFSLPLVVVIDFQFLLRTALEE